MKKISLISAAVLLTVAAECAKASLITQYGFTADYSASYNDPGVSVSAFSNGPAITAVGLESDGQPPKSWIGKNWTTSGNPADAADSGSYASFQIFTQPGLSLSLTRLTLDVRPHGQGPDDFLAQVIDLDTGFGTQMGALMFHSDQTKDVDVFKTWETLNAVSDSLQNLTGGFEIRIYGYDAGQADREVLIDNVQLEGTVTVVPEPSAFLLLALGTGLILHVKRRQTQE